MTEPAIPPPPPPPPPPVERACEECGASLDEHQEICVECGHAVGPAPRGRIRGTAPIASLAAFAVLVGASAAYGLSAGGASNVKDLGIGPKPPAPSTIAEATPTPPTPAPGTTSSSPDTVPQATPTPPTASNSSTPPSSPKPSKKAKAKKPASTTPSTAAQPGASNPSPPSSGGGGNSTPPKTHHHHHHTTTPSGPPSWFADADQPSDASGWGAGGASKAIDGSMKTAWTSGSTGTGVVIDDGKFQPYNDIGIATSTPGFAVTIYSKDQNTGSGNPSASGWKRVGHASSVSQYQKIPIKLPNNPPQYLLIYVTKLPSGGKASINEVRLVL